MHSPLCWIGGKSRLAGTIVEQLPEHRTYCEVFAGAGWVFFRKEPSRYEVLNDINSDLVCFYKVLQYHLEEFVKQFKWLMASRELFEDWNRQLEAGGLTDIQRMGFGGRVERRTYGGSVNRTPRVNLIRMEEDLSSAHLRLVKATVEHLDWERFIIKYDHPETLFYADPPYYGCEDYYGPTFERADFERLAEALDGIEGKFILSLNDLPEVRRIFGRFVLQEVSTRYSIECRGGQPKAAELLIRNF